MKSILIFMFGVSVTVFASDFPRVDQDLAEYCAKSASLRTEINKYKEDPSDKFWITLKIDNMFQLDQLMRNTLINLPSDHTYIPEEEKYFQKKLWKYCGDIDLENTAVLKVYLKIYKWFRISEFGEMTDNQAWVIVQHADFDPDFQKEIVSILAELYKLNETTPTNYAYLFDRVAASGSDPSKRTLQRYGTQGLCVGPGKWEPIPTEEPIKLDERRAGVGLPPIAEYIGHLSKYCK